MSDAGYVYIVTMQGVYDHGCAGVFTTREAAEKQAQALLDDSDWYHNFRVEELPLDRPLRTEPLHETWRDKAWKARPTPLATEFSAWTDPSEPS